MVEASGQSGADVLAKLQKEGDWNKSAIFTDTEEIITENQCKVLPDEIK